ncbi:unnamed protein product [Mytilus coruscus]|uniref:Ig-like domain-containing protein n=1 Tax=Mytilus coruscus TaxID=42192 RepID=A0A6J8CWX9_MYTCO|nr:unnamed protein product [Mytilus coruscus]
MWTVNDLFVDEGSSVILNCTCILSEQEVTWHGPNRSASSSKRDENNTMPYTAGSELNPQLSSTKIKVIRYNTTEKCILEITNFSTLDEGTYKCENFKIETQLFKVFVKSKPTNLTITTSSENQSMTVVEGRNSSLLCQVHSGRPKEELKLVVNDTITENGSGGVIYNFTPRKTDHNVSVSCEASSDIMSFPLMKKTRLNVHFKPTTDCTLEPKQLIEGRGAKLCCVVESNPRSNITCIMVDNDRRRLDTPKGGCLVWSLINRTQDGRYKCIAENYLGSDSSTLKVQVFYPPKVTIVYNITNGTLKLECSPSGVPNNYTFMQLEHRSEFNEHIRFLNFSNDGSVLRTSIEDVGIQDTGIYVCNVSNDVPDQYGRTFQSGKTFVELEDAPVFLGDDIIRYAKIGEVISISAVVYNRYEIRFNTTIQSKINIIHKLKISRSFVKVRKMFHGSSITLNASQLQVSFQLDLMTQKNFTIYNLKICNTYGCRDIKIDIRIDTSKNASQTEDLGEDTQGQSVENRLYQSREIVNSDNPAHVLQAQANGGYVYHAIASSSQAEPIRNEQRYLSGSHLNYSEVVFEAGPSSNSDIIHGANDKTIYSEIDLASSARFDHDCSDTSSDEDFIYIDGIVNLERTNEIK